MLHNMMFYIDTLGVKSFRTRRVNARSSFNGTRQQKVKYVSPSVSHQGTGATLKVNDSD